MLLNLVGKEKFIFVANTKSASTSIEDVLGSHASIQISNPPNLKHMSYSKILSSFSFIFKNKVYNHSHFYRFGVIRDPVEWVISWYNYRSRVELSDPKHPKHINYCGNISFEQFFENIENLNFMQNQRSKFLDSNGNNAMNFLIRFEKLDDDFSKVLDRLGIKLECRLDRKNESSRKSICRDSLAYETIQKIKDYYAEDYRFIEAYCQNE